jgi:hypothetical protein
MISAWETTAETNASHAEMNTSLTVRVAGTTLMLFLLRILNLMN